MKEKLIQQLFALLQQKKKVIEENLHQLKESLFSETKSSAGDKHETARAMVQLEFEQISKQLHETESLISQFTRISSMSPSKIGLGSLIQTNHSWFYLSIPMGKIQIDGIEIFCLGINAPLASLFTNKNLGDSIKFGDTEYKILAK